ncbi:MAG: alpha-tubulin [Paramarteilia canceri]
MGLGGAGVRMTKSTMEYIAREHQLGADGKLTTNNSNESSDLGQISFLFDEKKSGIYTPRCILADMDQTSFLPSKFGQGLAYNTNLQIKGSEGLDAANNFSRGFNTVNQEILPKILDSFRKIVESDEISSAVILHSVAGGSGSGLTAKVLTSIKEEILSTGSGSRGGSKIKIIDEALIPNTSVANSVLEPYNSVFYHSKTVGEVTDLALVFDNKGLFRALDKKLELKTATLNHANQLIGHLNSMLTIFARFPSQGSTLDFHDMPTNLVPFRWTKYIVPSLSPLRPKSVKLREVLNAQLLTKESLDNINCRLLDIEFKKFKCFSSALIYQGNFTDTELDISHRQAVEKKYLEFPDWTDSSYKISHTSIVPFKRPEDESIMLYSSKQAASLVNSSNYAGYLDRLGSQFDSMRSRRAFVHWICGEGTEEAEFDEARDVVREIQNHCTEK